MLAVLLAAALGCCWLLATRSNTVQDASSLYIKPLASTDRDHLLIYAFSYSDEQSLENLKYFVAEAVTDDTVADYIIIVQEGPELKVRCKPTSKQLLLGEPRT
jgi:hypothetical protein